MASPTQTVIGKGTPNLLIAEDLLKILKDFVPSSPPKSPTNLTHRMVGSQKHLCSFLQQNELGFVTLTVNLRQAELPDPSGLFQVNTKPLTIKLIKNPRCYIDTTLLTTNFTHL